MSNSAQSPKRRGLCLILSSPSGAGKTTLARLLLASDAGLSNSISVTTRAPRPKERNGLDYHFVSRAKFEELRDSGNLLEWAEVFGNFYGTPAEPVKATLATGKDIVFDVDWQGAASIASVLPDDTVRIFILPPSAEELSRRIHARAAEPEDVIDRRLRAAASEIGHWDEYDYVLVNSTIEESLAALQTILKAERLKRGRQVGLSAFVAGLIEGAAAAPDAAQGEQNRQS